MQGGGVDGILIYRILSFLLQQDVRALIQVEVLAQGP